MSDQGAQPDPAIVGEVVPLTDEEQVDLLEAWRFLNLVPDPAAPEKAEIHASAEAAKLTAYVGIFARILSAHGFNPSGGTVSWSEEGVVVRGRRAQSPTE